MITKHYCRFWLLKNIENLWYFVKEKYFLAVHLVFDPEELITAPKLNGLNESKVIFIYSGLGLNRYNNLLGAEICRGK